MQPELILEMSAHTTLLILQPVGIELTNGVGIPSQSNSTTRQNWVGVAACPGEYDTTCVCSEAGPVLHLIDLTISQSARGPVYFDASYSVPRQTIRSKSQTGRIELLSQTNVRSSDRGHKLSTGSLVHSSVMRLHVLKSEMSSHGTFRTEQLLRVVEVPLGFETTAPSQTRSSFSQKKSHAS